MKEMETAPMTERTVAHSTFVIDRHYPATPGRVFAAFADKATKRRWCVEGEGFTIEEFEMDFRVGGRERSRFRYEGGTPIVCDAIYQDIVPDERIVFAYTMSAGDTRMSSSLTTIELRPAGAGTVLVFTEQGAFFDGSPATAGWSPKEREHGTRGLLDQLAKEFANV
jgi:uncharacterized protein YndB with AHSA1/START domain